MKSVDWPGSGYRHVAVFEEEGGGVREGCGKEKNFFLDEN